MTASQVLSTRQRLAKKKNLSSERQRTVRYPDGCRIADENKATLALIDKLKLEPIIKQESALGYVNVKVALPRDAVINQIARA